MPVPQIRNIQSQIVAPKLTHTSVHNKHKQREYFDTNTAAETMAKQQELSKDDTAMLIIVAIILFAISYVILNTNTKNNDILTFLQSKIPMTSSSMLPNSTFIGSISSSDNFVNPYVL